MFVTIIRRPDGEAPEWVREAWVGLTLPTACPHKHVLRTVGVLSVAPRFWAHVWAFLRGRAIRVEGYTVNAKEAVDLLSGCNPPAARWWRDNLPHLLRGRSVFVFEAEECEPQEG
jgi:hypothetical protein